MSRRKKLAIAGGLGAALAALIGVEQLGPIIADLLAQIL